MALLGGFMGLKFGLELLVSLDPLRGVTTGFDQRFGIAALTLVAFTQGFENIHGVSSLAAF